MPSLTADKHYYLILRKFKVFDKHTFKKIFEGNYIEVHNNINKNIRIFWPIFIHLFYLGAYLYIYAILNFRFYIKIVLENI